METIIVYMLKVNIAIALFYLLYKLLFVKDTFFVARRFYLLAVVVFSFVYPLLPVLQIGTLFDFLIQTEEVHATVEFDTLGMGATTILEDVAEPASINWMAILKASVVMASAFFAIRLLWQFIRIFKIKNNSKQRMLFDVRYQHLPSKSTPFSFFKWIFIYPEAHTNEKLKQILTHEQVHVVQWHSVDITLMELLIPLLWYNPFFWLLRNEMSINIEFIADQGVLGKGFDRRDYQYNILHLTYPRNNIQIVNNFNVSQLKQRIMMMNNKKTPMKNLVKYILVLPVALLLITANSVYAQNKEPQKTKSTITILGEKTNDTIKGKPLIVIDDVVMGEDYDLGSLSPEDIESMTVLRDSAAVSTYGVDAGRGVILIRSLKKDEEKISSINDKKLLIVVDGVKKEKGFDLSSINPTDIKSVSVLKDDKAVGVYGEDGKDGVVVIATKKSNLDITPSNGNSKLSNGEDVFVVVDQMPVFPGGNEGMFKFLAESIKYPVDAQKNGLQGRVICNFVITKDGSIEDVQVVRGVAPSLDAEAVRVIESMPKWEPARNKGEKVNVKFTMPLVFRLQGGESMSEPVQGSEIIKGKGINIIDEVVAVALDKSENKNEPHEIFIVVEEQPEFPGGAEAMMAFLSENVKYPDIAKENGIQGRVVVNFVVEKDGSITEINIVRGVDPSLDMEAKRVIENMPKWKPGKQRGHEVRVRFTLPIDFRLPPKEDDIKN